VGNLLLRLLLRHSALFCPSPDVVLKLLQRETNNETVAVACFDALAAVTRLGSEVSSSNAAVNTVASWAEDNLYDAEPEVQCSPQWPVFGCVTASSIGVGSLLQSLQRAVAVIDTLVTDGGATVTEGQLPVVMELIKTVVSSCGQSADSVEVLSTAVGLTKRLITNTDIVKTVRSSGALKAVVQVIAACFPCCVLR
jgi:hypothetical protein